MSSKPVLQLTYAQTEYFVGDQVSGEIALFVPATLEGILGVEIRIWAEEICCWHECADALSRSAKPQRSHMDFGDLLREHESDGVQYSGTRYPYNTRRIVWAPQDNVLQQGAYVLPFTYYLPFKVPASTQVNGCGFSISVKHWCHVCLLPKIPVAELIKGYTRSGAEDKDGFFKLLKQPHREVEHWSSVYLASCTKELVVIEKALHQATLRPYSFQCTYSIPQMFVRNGELIVSTKKCFSSFVPGEEIPLVVEILNQTQITINLILVTLRHTVTTKSAGGYFKEIVYNHTRWVKPVSIPGHKNAIVEHVSIPLRLPLTVSPTSHGTTATNEWDLLVSCRYRGKFGLMQHITGQDVIFPICIWPSTVHPVRRSGNPPRNALFDPVLAIDKESALIFDSDKTLPPQQLLPSLIPEDAPVTTLPTATLETVADAGTPKPESVTMLTRIDVKEPTLSGPLPGLAHHQFTGAVDAGTTMSASLAKLLSVATRNETQDKNIKIPKNRQIVRVKRAIVPLQT